MAPTESGGEDHCPRIPASTIAAQTSASRETIFNTSRSVASRKEVCAARLVVVIGKDGCGEGEAERVEEDSQV